MRSACCRVYIGECGSTLYVGLTGISSDTNTKVNGDGLENFKHFFPLFLKDEQG